MNDTVKNKWNSFRTNFFLFFWKGYDLNFQKKITPPGLLSIFAAKSAKVPFLKNSWKKFWKFAKKVRNMVFRKNKVESYVLKPVSFSPLTGTLGTDLIFWDIWIFFAQSKKFQLMCQFLADFDRFSNRQNSVIRACWLTVFGIRRLLDMLNLMQTHIFVYNQTNFN